MHNVNEYYENDRLFHELDNAPRSAFLKAVRAYSAADGMKSQAWLVENIIRTSRGVGNDNDVMPIDVQSSFVAIMARYAAFATSDDTSQPVTTFREARKLIVSLFF